jgi:DNA mismatch endonuclease (patch repair protein)
MERSLKTRLRGGTFNVSPERSRNMAAVRGKGNKTTEVKLKMALVRAGVSGWVMQSADLPGKPDFYFPEAQLAVFVDGCFWHGCPRCGRIPKTNRAFWKAKIERNRARHKKVRRWLNRQGVRTLRFWEHQLKENLDRCVSRIASIVS